MQKSFYSDHFKKTVIISISLNDIDFIFSTLEEDYSFYDFSKDQWPEKFSKHMQAKPWFTKEMYQFIDKNIKL